MRNQAAEQINQIKRLLSDLERLQAGTTWAPGLMASPILNRWIYSARKVPCLEGIVEGHQFLSTGRWATTSEVFAHFHEDDEHFVRTRNRWYRLGAPGQSLDRWSIS
ncbi:hypothetical protein [Rhizobium leguminosarum]|uniref:hypothetical protein n=1 Tax=Rhizobium leguminosarum TaxID=384 RepID=UPI001031FA95|nr:hypothetical protein [Rhizobium leguminosarum]TAY99661.1 hypothetical protein ELH79_14750 [Rhizobium leguminosarum]TAZ10531.1 hypothetical protein ELH78_15635 [Rhizobium leguminosarum]